MISINEDYLQEYGPKKEIQEHWFNTLTTEEKSKIIVEALDYWFNTRTSKEESRVAVLSFKYWFNNCKPEQKSRTLEELFNKAHPTHESKIKAKKKWQELGIQI